MAAARWLSWPPFTPFTLLPLSPQPPTRRCRQVRNERAAQRALGFSTLREILVGARVASIPYDVVATMGDALSAATRQKGRASSHYMDHLQTCSRALVTQVKVRARKGWGGAWAAVL